MDIKSSMFFRMVIRIRCDATDAQCQLGMKFGCNPVTEAPELLRIARSLDINVIGVSFHVGSGCREPQVFRRAIAASRDIFDYASSLGYQFHLLDIGGGYPGGRDTSIDKVSSCITTFKRTLIFIYFNGGLSFTVQIKKSYIGTSKT